MRKVIHQQCPEPWKNLPFADCSAGDRGGVLQWHASVDDGPKSRPVEEPMLLQRWPRESLLDRMAGVEAGNQQGLESDQFLCVLVGGKK